MENIRISKVENVTLDRFLPPASSSGSPIPHRQIGSLHLTPHHLIFRPSPSPSLPDSSSSTSAEQRDNDEIWISYPSITLFTRLPQTFAGKYPLQIRTRAFEGYVLSFDKAMEGGAEDVWLSVKDCAVATSVEQLYAFFYHLPPSAGSSSSKIKLDTLVASSTSPLDTLSTSTSNTAMAASSASGSGSGWSTYNPRTEFARQGVGSRTKAWRFTDINKDYSYSPTYPAKMVVPSRISDSTLAYAGKYRSKGRIPALTYLHWANQASITRSSQPMVGLKNARSAQDERLIECIFTSHLFLDTAYNATSTAIPPQSSTSPSQSGASGPIYGATSTNLIIDARPTTNAMANVAMGAGTENMENYKAAKKAYLGIDNIHVMRNSLKTIAEALRDAEGPSSSSSSSSSSAAQIPLDRALLRKSNWLKHISTILDGSLIIIKNIHLNASHVLIHCSDGWDRTAQLSAVAQICLDPCYRTIDGFKVLIEKDWLSFGHKFLDRSGHLSSEKTFTVTEAPDEDSDDELGGGGGGGAQRAAQAFFASVQKQFNKTDSHLKEVSPVFHQFLDCIRQIQRQFPDRFEFNEEWLLDIHYHLYSCQFGTFLFNNERERRGAESTKGTYIDRTVSAWEWFDRPEVRQKYVNKTYNPSLDDRETRTQEADQGVLLYDPRDVRWWFRLFRRGDEEMNGPKIPFQPSATGINRPDINAQGADMVIVPPGQTDPVSAEGAIEAVKAGVVGTRGDSRDLFVSGPGSSTSGAGSRGPSPGPASDQWPDRPIQRGSSAAATPNRQSHAALEGPSGKGTYRGIESTSSAFSLQTAGQPSPNPDNDSSQVQNNTYFPSTSLAGLPSSSRQQASSGYTPRSGTPTNHQTTNPASSTSGSGSSWNWSQFSSGAISALTRGAKEIRTIGEGAYNQIRAEVGEYDRDAAGYGQGQGQMVEKGTGLGEGKVGGVSTGPGRPVRLPSEANPWSTGATWTSGASPVTGAGREGEIGGRQSTTAGTSQKNMGNGVAGAATGSGSGTPITNLPRIDSTTTTGSTSNTAGPSSSGRPNAARQASWNTNPWGDPTPSTSGSGSLSNRIQNPELSIPLAAGTASDEVRHSLSDLRLGQDNSNSSRRNYSNNITAPASGPRQVQGQGKQAKADEDLVRAAMGGDARAWDPLGAA